METVKDKLSDNELIAKFMGLPAELLHDTPTGTFTRKIDYEEYFKEWNNLMPAFSRFSSLEFQSNENNHIHSDLCAAIADKVLRVDIIGVHEKLVEGIKWYNNTQTPSPNEYRRNKNRK